MANNWIHFYFNYFFFYKGEIIQKIKYEASRHKRILSFYIQETCKISINKEKKENSIHATVNNASFVGSSYQYILNSNAGKLFVISGETNDIFKVGEEVFLSINDQEVKILND